MSGAQQDGLAGADGSTGGALVWTGRGALARAGAVLDDLLLATAAPVTARRPWLQVWVDRTPAFTPLVVGIGTPSRLEAAAVLATRRRGPLVSVCAVGRGPSDYQALPARSDAAAEDLAAAVAAELRRLHRPWVLRVEQLPVGDPVAAALARRLPRATAEPGVGSPTVRFGDVREVSAHLSANGRKAARKGVNRLGGEGASFDVAVLTDPGAIADQLPEVAAVRRRRDHDARATSSLDDPREAAMWRDVVLAHAARGEVELVVARVGAVVAAYAVVFRDGGARRIWDLRHHPDLARFNPGRLLARELLARALADPDARELDWMNGEEPYKFAMTDTVVAHEALLAASSPVVAAIAGAWRRRGELAGAARHRFTGRRSA